MEEITIREFKNKNIDLQKFKEESPHFQELILSQNNISIPLSWRSYTNIKDNKQANIYLHNLINEIARIEPKIITLSDEINQNIKFEQDEPEYFEMEVALADYKNYDFFKLRKNQKPKDENVFYISCDYELAKLYTDDKYKIAINDIYILNNELNEYIKAARKIEELIIVNRGYVRHELRLVNKFDGFKYYSGIAAEVEKLFNDNRLKEYYIKILND